MSHYVKIDVTLEPRGDGTLRVAEAAISAEGVDPDAITGILMAAVLGNLQSEAMDYYSQRYPLMNTDALSELAGSNARSAAIDALVALPYDSAPDAMGGVVDVEA